MPKTGIASSRTRLTPAADQTFNSTTPRPCSHNLSMFVARRFKFRSGFWVCLLMSQRSCASVNLTDNTRAISCTSAQLKRNCWLMISATAVQIGRRLCITWRMVKHTIIAAVPARSRCVARCVSTLTSVSMSARSRSFDILLLHGRPNMSTTDISLIMCW